MKENELGNLKDYFNGVIGEGAIIKRRKRTEREIKIELFTKIIQDIEEMDIRSHMINTEVKIDLSTYDELFYNVIYNLIEFHFGKEKFELIYYYLYERINEDGTPNLLKNQKGDVLKLDNPEDLFFTLESIEQQKNAKS